MKLKNKWTGEINIVKVDKDYFNICKDDGEFVCPVTLKELNEGWEDVPEEPKGIQCIYYVNHFDAAKIDGVIVGFETKEEAELAVRKLKAWKRLKDKGFKVDLWCYDGGNYQERIETGRILFRVKDYEENEKDLDLLFGGEE